MDDAQTHLVPYLSFDGTCEEAMKFYHSVLGGELAMQTFADAFPDTPEEHRNRIMHAMLETGRVMLMASDTHPDHSPPVRFGNNVHISINGNDTDTLTSYFTALSQNGTVDMKLEPQFRGDTFGMLTDKFGIHWMVNIFQPQE